MRADEEAPCEARPSQLPQFQLAFSWSLTELATLTALSIPGGQLHHECGICAGQRGPRSNSAMQISAVRNLGPDKRTSSINAIRIRTLARRWPQLLAQPMPAPVACQKVRSLGGDCGRWRGERNCGLHFHQYEGAYVCLRGHFAMASNSAMRASSTFRARFSALRACAVLSARASASCRARSLLASRASASASGSSRYCAVFRSQNHRYPSAKRTSNRTSGLHTATKPPDPFSQGIRSYPPSSS